ncbi:MAG TPA: polyprenyl synthetase family protein [Solirubrobacteraceae bacterium]
MTSAVGHTAADSPAGDGPTGDSSTGDSSTGDSSTGDIDAVEVIMRRGGAGLRERMARIELHLERVTAAAGTPLAAHANATIVAGGKRLRPLLVVLAAEAAGGVLPAPGADPAPPTRLDPAPPTRPAPPSPLDTTSPSSPHPGLGEECLVRAAVAVELVHSATLVHDDVIDGAQLRRGHPTVATVAGRAVAVATGDLLFSRAFAELARNGDLAQLRALSDASSALAAGELLQHEDAYAAHVAVERYLRRCELKTAALFEAACRLGALVAVEPSPALADALGVFARHIGLAFQMLDDVLDVSGPVERTGKSRGTDLLDGTVTLPLILARERDSELADFDLSSLGGAGGPQKAEQLCERIAATGALDEARERALAVVAEAKAALPASLPPGRSSLLHLVADAVVERYR